MFLVILSVVSAAIVAFIIYTMTMGKLRVTLPLENESLAEWLNASKERGNEEDGEVALHAGVQAGGGKAGGIWAEYRGGGAQPGFGGADVVQLGEGAA
jgi:hypothetical protein